MEDIEYFFVCIDSSDLATITFPKGLTKHFYKHTIERFLDEELKNEIVYKFPIPNGKNGVWLKKIDFLLKLSNYPLGTLDDFYPNSFTIDFKEELLKPNSLNIDKISSEKGQYFSLNDFFKILNI